MEAIHHTDRTYVFDNSGLNKERTWLAEITGGKVLELKTNEMPAWFKRAAEEGDGLAAEQLTRLQSS